MNNPFLGGYERDVASGLDYANARMYANGRGRFMQPDPLGLGAAELKKPQSLNLYSYAANDPVNFIDVTGLKPSLNCMGGVVSMDGGVWNEYTCSVDPDGIFGGYSGGSGNPRGGAQELPKYDDAKKNFEDFLKQNPGCTGAIDKIVGKEGAYEDAFNSIRWLNALGLSDAELKRGRLSSYGETGPTRNLSLYNVFADPRGQINDAIAIWTGQTPTVIVHFQGIQPRERVVAHETLHILFKGDHRETAEKLGLGKFEGKDAEKNASNAINDYLNNNCGVERK